MRRNVWIPDELDEAMRARYPNVNLSELVQSAVAKLIECDHHDVGCIVCGTRLRIDDLGREAASSLWRDAWGRLAVQLAQGATLTGFGRVLRQVGMDHGVLRALEAIEPRPSRAAHRDAQGMRGVA